ncbi:MAG: patatin-like phospholipase family protein [bacterium]|nr:patatin-like phospholipase family protein [bacterium]
MRYRFWITVLIVVLAACALTAAERPLVGLALSGGGAKGLAYIGVIRVLEEEGIDVDVVTGTSIGAVIGSLYAAGYTTAEIESLVITTPWGDLFEDAPRHRDLGMEQKLYDERYQITLPLRKHGPGLPAGVVPGQNVSMLLEWMAWPVRDVRDFRALPRAFACVATDLETGQAVRLDHGNLPEAVRASFAIPSVFTPVEIEGRLLVDGGVVRNLPAEDARALGAEIVIGVDVASPLRDREKLGDLVSILNQTMNFQETASAERQRAMCDILIRPDIEGFTIMDFARFRELISLGERAAREKLPELRALADSLKRYPPRATCVLPVTDDTVRVRVIAVEGLQRTSTRVVTAHLGFHLPQWTTRPRLHRALERVYSSQFYERVSYQLDPVADGSALRVKVVEKETDLLRFGFRYDSDDHAAALANVTLRNLVARGSMTTLDARLGERNTFTFSQFLYTGFTARIGTRLVVEHNRTEVGSVRPGPLRYGTRVRDTRATLLLGSIFAKSAVLGGGVERVHTRYLPPGTEEIAPRRIIADYHALFGLAYIETLDRLTFPSRGGLLNASAEYADQDIGANFEFVKLDGKLSVYVPFKNRISVGVGGAAALADGDVQPPDHYFGLGGVDDFLGAELDERTGTCKQTAWLSVQWEPWRKKFIRLRGNIGNVFDEWNERFDWDRYEKGGGLTVGAITLAGPVQLTVHGGTLNDVLVHFRFGYNF